MDDWPEAERDEWHGRYLEALDGLLLQKSRAEKAEKLLEAAENQVAALKESVARLKRLQDKPSLEKLVEMEAEVERLTESERVGRLEAEKLRESWRIDHNALTLRGEELLDEVERLKKVNALHYQEAQVEHSMRMLDEAEVEALERDVKKYDELLECAKAEVEKLKWQRDDAIDSLVTANHLLNDDYPGNDDDPQIIAADLERRWEER